MKTNITTAINALTSALVKIGTDDKAALGDLSLAKLSIEKACCALNNTIYPEGTSGYIKLNAEGLPLPVGEEKSADTKCDTESEPSTPKSPIQRELDFLSENLPNFSAEDLETAYTTKGIPGAVKYLLTLSGSDIIGDPSLITTIDSNKLTFSVAPGIISDNAELVREHLVKLLGFVGYELVNCDISHNTDCTTFTFSIRRKSASKSNCYVISPLLFAAGRFLGII